MLNNYKKIKMAEDEVTKYTRQLQELNEEKQLLDNRFAIHAISSSEYKRRIYGLSRRFNTCEGRLILAQNMLSKLQQEVINGQG